MIIELLNSTHERNSFDCGIPSLNQYLQVQAGQHAKRDITRTYVAVEENTVAVAGYYSLCAGSISFEIVPDNLPHHPIPIVLLARLATDKGVQGQGLGKMLLLDALTTTLSIADQIGVYAMAVDALNQEAFTFYLRYGFKSLSDDRLHLYLPIKTIRKLIA
jgi:GNAT superfamily N-acetyltransferase